RLQSALGIDLRNLAKPLDRAAGAVDGAFDADHRSVRVAVEHAAQQPIRRLDPRGHHALHEGAGADVDVRGVGAWLTERKNGGRLVARADAQRDLVGFGYEMSVRV